MSQNDCFFTTPIFSKKCSYFLLSGSFCANSVSKNIYGSPRIQKNGFWADPGILGASFPTLKSGPKIDNF